MGLWLECVHSYSNWKSCIRSCSSFFPLVSRFIWGLSCRYTTLPMCLCGLLATFLRVFSQSVYLVILLLLLRLVFCRYNRTSSSDKWNSRPRYVCTSDRTKRNRYRAAFIKSLFGYTSIYMSEHQTPRNLPPFAYYKRNNRLMKHPLHDKIKRIAKSKEASRRKRLRILQQPINLPHARDEALLFFFS